VKLTGDNSVALAGTKVDISSATVTSTEAVTVKLPATAATAFDVQSDITLHTQTTDLTAGVKGHGTLKVGGVVTAATITGTGNIQFTGAPTFATAGAFSNTGLTTFDSVLSIGGATSFAGPVVFEKAVSVATGAISFAGEVTFKDDLTLTQIGANFGKAAYFAAGKKITGTSDASVITLKPGASLGLPVTSGTPSVFGAIIANSGNSDVTLTPAANTTLTFAEGRILTQDNSGSAVHSIAIGGTTPEASLVAGATYKVASASGKVGTLTIGNGGKLVLAAGVLSDAVDYNNLSAKLILTGASGVNGALLTGAGTVAAGGTAIVPSTQGWQVVDTGGTGTVTIEADTITATAATVTLAGVASGTGTITVAKTKTLKIAANTAIDLTDSGSIVLTQGVSSDGGIINLSATTAKIAGLTGGSGNRTLVASNIDNGIFTVGTASGKVQGDGSSGAGGAYITGGNDTGPNPIQADDNGNVTIDRSTTVGGA
jgi:hypothetical protein